MENPIIFKIGGKIKKPKIQKIFENAKKEKVTLNGELEFSIEEFKNNLKIASNTSTPIIFETENSKGNLPLLEKCCIENNLSFHRFCRENHRQPTITVYNSNNDKRFKECGPQTLPIDIDTGTPLVPLDIMKNISSGEKNITPNIMWGLITEAEYKNKKIEVSREYKKINGQAPMTINRFIINLKKFFEPIKVEITE
jgi:hypothetical protein